MTSVYKTSFGVDNYTSFPFLPDANGNISEYVQFQVSGLEFQPSVVAHYEYSPFGQVTFQSGEMAGEFKHKFSTKYHDSEFNGYYYGYREYFVGLGRWGSYEPLGERGFEVGKSASLENGQLFANIGGERLGRQYSFLDNNPVEYVDVLGMYGNQVPPCAPYPECLKKLPNPYPPPTPPTNDPAPPPAEECKESEPKPIGQPSTTKCYPKNYYVWGPSANTSWDSETGLCTCECEQRKITQTRCDNTQTFRITFTCISCYNSQPIETHYDFPKTWTTYETSTDGRIYDEDTVQFFTGREFYCNRKCASYCVGKNR